MESIKEEAVRAKKMAEKKFEERDIAGAKRFALRAQNLNPKIDGLLQLIATLDVYISAEEGANGVSDWYKVLGVEPCADEPTIRNQFKKLACVIHPDRNKSVGADGAFKILSQAWSSLSDKQRRCAYDQKRKLKSENENILVRQSHLSNSNVSNSPLNPTFWTVCYGCKAQFEYPRLYLRRNILCSKCRRPFHANEVPPPPNNDNGSSKPLASHMQRHNPGESAINNSSSAQGTRPTSAASAERARFFGLNSSQKTSQAGLFSEVTEKERGKKEASSEGMKVPTFAKDRWSWKRKFKEESLDSMTEVTKTSPRVLKKEFGGVSPGFSGAGLGTLPEGGKPQKRRRMPDQNMEGSVETGNGGFAVKTVFGSQEGGTATTRWNMAGNCKLSFTKELSQKEVRNMLMEKARKVVRGKLIEWRTAAAPKIPYKSKEVENEKGKKEAATPVVKADMSKHTKHVDTKKKESTGKIAPRKIDLNLTPGIPDPILMTVIDPDFYDFDRNRTERSFSSNQVWAAYDQEDGMPRYYAMIHWVISVEPFRMKISWLNSKSNDEFGPLSWIASGFPKTSGEFRPGKHKVYVSLHSFSHQVKWTRGVRGVVQIYPRKGDVWALYRNWSPDWNERTPDEVIHKYDMVEVLRDYNEARGVSVFPLVKVVGFKTVFCRHWDLREVKTIPREEMFRFSHQVPSHFLIGNEGLNAPPDCLELDPAATPLELLEGTKEARKKEVVKTAEKPKEEGLMESLQSPKVCELVENHKPAIEKYPLQDAEKVVAEKKGKENGEVKLAVYNRRRIREGKKI
ncbi:Curved DNA-binding protein [Morus notabilis]|uniref:Curved DNA-binding protein n=1 Tax=Morus notabilis TaxID=981085 RepID=W9RDX9_9ROSA|nr:uncharacterized protein LOC21384713 [Morus notabilis]EXB72706.1 Curved DNA-binding protein [Morus notabilis]